MPSHTYTFIKILDHLGVNVTIWRMVITQTDLKCQRLSLCSRLKLRIVQKP